MNNDVMATCLGWTNLDGCGECIIPLSDPYYISSLDPDCILFICRELLSAFDYKVSSNEVILLTKSYSTCSGTIYIYIECNEISNTQLNIEYNKLVYIYTVGYWAAYYSGYIQRRNIIDIATSIITINRLHDRDELRCETDNLYKMLEAATGSITKGITIYIRVYS
jgi:hypothetical protein